MESFSNHIVSPYLQLVPEDRLAAFVAAARPELAARVDAGDLALIFDVLGSRLVAASRRELALLERLRRQGSVGADDAADASAIRGLAGAELLLPADEAFRRHAYKSIEIEINRHCNYRCRFCPVETAPKPKGFMTDELYELVVQRAREYGAFMVSLNHYSEPTLDPRLVDRARTAAAAGLWVRLHTNASLLTEEKIRDLAELGRVWAIVNLPTVDPVEYERVTGAKMFDRVMENLRLMHRYGLRVTLSINAPKDSADADVRDINALLAEMFGPSVRWPTDSRGGRIDRSEYAIGVRHAGPLSGCGLAITQLNVSHEGKAFLCCQDFDQQYVLGDLREQTVREVAESDLAVSIRKWLFGYESAPASFLCATCEWTEPAARQRLPLAVGSEAKREMLVPGGLTAERLKSVRLVVTRGDATPHA